MKTFNKKCGKCEGTGFKRTHSRTSPDPIKCDNCGGTGNIVKEELTVELASKIIDAFGSCTTIYECTTPEELIEDYNASDYERTIADLVSVQLTVEDIHVDRSLSAAQME